MVEVIHGTRTSHIMCERNRLKIAFVKINSNINMQLLTCQLWNLCTNTKIIIVAGLCYQLEFGKNFASILLNASVIIRDEVKKYEQALLFIAFYNKQNVYGSKICCLNPWPRQIQNTNVSNVHF